MDKKKIAIVIILAVVLILLTLYFTASFKKTGVDDDIAPAPTTTDNIVNPFEIPTEEITIDPDFEIEIIPIEE